MTLKPYAQLKAQASIGVDLMSIQDAQEHMAGRRDISDIVFID